LTYQFFGMPIFWIVKEETMRKQHHVVPNPKGGWDVIHAGSGRASAHAETKQAAVDIGRDISRRQGTEFIIHGMDGKIQQSDSHGNDPFPPKG
jgi:hypothetical protein